MNLPASRVIIPSAYYFRKKPALHGSCALAICSRWSGAPVARGASFDRGEAFVVCPKPTDVSWARALGAALRGDADRWRPNVPDAVIVRRGAPQLARIAATIARALG